MRRARVLLVALLLLIAFPAQEAWAINHNCETTNCGYKCQVFGQFQGWCLWTSVTTTGCIQDFGPYCASLQNAYCCREGSSGGF